MKPAKVEQDSQILDYRIYVNENFEKYDYDQWLFQQLHLAPGQSVLDLGCGTGKHLFQFPEFIGTQGNVVGLDVSQESLAKCQQKIKQNNINNINVYNSDLTKIHETLAGRHSFDRILSSFAIYYTQDAPKTFQDCYQLLKKNGSLFVCGPGRNNNAAFLELVEQAGGTFSDDFLRWSDFLEKTATPLLKKIFGNVEMVTFENPIEFPSVEILFNYWKATALYDPRIEKTINTLIEDEFTKNSVFINTKVVLGLRCTKRE